MKTIKQISAGGIVYKKIENSLWLICKHSSHKGWVFPKGLVGDKDTTESMETAALREVNEEGGIKAKIINEKPIQVEYTYKLDGNIIYKTVYYFLMEYISGDPKDHDFEMSEAEFVTEDEVKKTLTYQSDKDAFNQMLKILK